MPRPMSLDLRERAVKRVLSGESTRMVAEALGVAPSSVTKWWHRFRETGSAAPGQMGGHKPRVLSGENRNWLLERIRHDFTLWGLVHELAERCVKVDYRSVWEFVHAEGLSFKKKHSAQRAKPARGGTPTRAVAETSKPYRPKTSCFY